MRIPTGWLLAVGLAVGAGLIEMRVRVAEVLTSVQAVEKRVERIEAGIDARDRVGFNER